MKKLVSLLLIVLTVLSLAACGNEANPTTTAPKPTGTIEWE